MAHRGVEIAGRAAIVLAPLLFLSALEGVARLLRLEERVAADLAIPQWIDRDQLARKLPLERLSGRADDLRSFYGAYRPDRFLFYRLKPNLHTPMVDILDDRWREQLAWTLDTNEIGYRGPVPATPRLPGSVRVACLGDSSTFGWGLSQDESYPARLGHELSRRYGPGRVEVLNFGVPGYTSFQGSVLLEREVLRWDPDVVTIAYGANDDAFVGVTSQERYARASSWVGLAQAALARSEAYGALKGLLLRARRADAAARFAEARDGSAGGRLDVSHEEYAAVLGRMVGTLRSRGIDVILVAQCLSRKPESRLHVLKRVAEEASVPLVDIFALSREAEAAVAADPYLGELAARYARLYGEEALAANPKLRYLLPDACHPNALLAELAARRLAEVAGAGSRLRRTLGEVPR